MASKITESNVSKYIVELLRGCTHYRLSSMHGENNIISYSQFIEKLSQKPVKGATKDKDAPKMLQCQKELKVMLYKSLMYAGEEAQGLTNIDDVDESKPYMFMMKQLSVTIPAEISRDLSASAAIINRFITFKSQLTNSALIGSIVDMYISMIYKLSLYMASVIRMKISQMNIPMLISAMDFYKLNDSLDIPDVIFEDIKDSLNAS